MATNYEFAVVPLPAGGWAVKRCVDEQPISVHSCQALAQGAALRLAQPTGGCVVVLQQG